MQDLGSDLSRHDGVLAGASIDAMNELGVLFFVKDRERRFVLGTDALVHHLGYRSARQLIGLRDEDISPAHLVEHYREYDERVLTSGERVAGLAELVRNADGSYDWFSTTKWPLRDPRGAIVGLAGVIQSLKPRNPITEELLPLTPAVELIADQYSRKISVEELAAAATMSVSYFTRQFKRRFGTTPHRYLRSVRMIAACELLCTTDLSIMAIAHQSGFYDHSHLTNEFTRTRGMTPQAYRDRYRKRPAIDPTPRAVSLRIAIADRV